MQFLFQPVLGAASDRFGRRPIILLSNLGNPAAWNIVAPTVLEQISEIKGLPAAVVPMLQSLGTYTNIGEITSTITAIESSITN